LEPGTSRGPAQHRSALSFRCPAEIVFLNRRDHRLDVPEPGRFLDGAPRDTGRHRARQLLRDDRLSKLRGAPNDRPPDRWPVPRHGSWLGAAGDQEHLGTELEQVARQAWDERRLASRFVCRLLVRPIDHGPEVRMRLEPERFPDQVGSFDCGLEDGSGAHVTTDASEPQVRAAELCGNPALLDPAVLRF
jgi:hypothetical protein